MRAWSGARSYAILPSAMQSAQLMAWFHSPFKLKMSEVVSGFVEETLFRLAGTHFECIVWTKF